MIDYSMPTMKAERALKELHLAMLKRDYKGAKDWALVAVAEARLAYASIEIMKEREHGHEQVSKVVQA